MGILRIFQEQADLAYIYAIRPMADGTFTFTIDPSADPGEFGELIRPTDALLAAREGVPAVDEESYQDRWGRFYSAYCPVFDSRGSVAGIVAVDFDAAWYERQISRHMYTVLIISALSLLIGGLVVLLITGGLRKRLAELDAEMDHLTDDMEELAAELRLASGQQAEAAEPVRGKLRRSEGGDEFIAVLEDASPENAGSLLEALDEKIAAMPLSVSKGTAEFRRDMDIGFNDVFRRADEAMYQNKAAYYAAHGSRRRSDREKRTASKTIRRNVIWNAGTCL